ncbi:MAG: hypothetical protein Q4F83_13085 [Eubacteriales bacterium]|nr:hypothetical protein [Eubacteriales bacterium]
MRTIEFSIEDNGDQLTIGEMIGVKEYYCPGGYSYMIENAIGMSGLYQFRERIKSTKGKVIEIKKTERFNIAVLEFDE